MLCADCKKWFSQHVTDYADGSRVINWQPPVPGRGMCEYLGYETVSDFGCNKFEEGHEHVKVLGKKTGSPWHHSHYDRCPDCQGIGWDCKRCAGTGHVLYYDDGHVGEEQHRRHPNEDKLGPPPEPKCPGCDRVVDPNWVACPFCGARTNKPDELVQSTEVL